MLMMEFNYWHEGLTHEKMMECVALRADYEYPEGRKPLAEYWMAGVDPHMPAVISIFEAEEFGPLLSTEMLWSEYFDIKFVPIVSADDGVKFIREALEEMKALVG